jgi:hypothetical protein
MKTDTIYSVTVVLVVVVVIVQLLCPSSYMLSHSAATAVHSEETFVQNCIVHAELALHWSYLDSTVSSMRNAIERRLCTTVMVNNMRARYLCTLMPHCVVACSVHIHYRFCCADE